MANQDAQQTRAEVAMTQTALDGERYLLAEQQREGRKLMAKMKELLQPLQEVSRKYDEAPPDPSSHAKHSEEQDRA